MTHRDDDLGRRTSENVINSILSSSYEIYEDFEDKRPENLIFHGDELAQLPLFDEEDKLCVMHRDAHFSGSFAAMKAYYDQPEAKGIIEEIDSARIALLETIQNGMKTDLAPLLITGADAEKIALSKRLYRELSELCQKEPSSPEGALASAILSEEEVDEMVANASGALLEKPASLLLLAHSELFCDPLFPGYGTASLFAIRLLGKIRYEPAVADLFALIGRREFEVETAVLETLRKIGPAARNFAIDRLTSFPITADHERAALVLIEFLPDDEISNLFVHILSDKRVRNTKVEGYLKLGVETSCGK